MFYKIDFEVYNGTFYSHDVALVIANNISEASEKLRQLVNSTDDRKYISNICRISEFNGDVFTGRNGCN